MGSVQSTLVIAGLVAAGSAAVYYFYGQSEPSSKPPGQPITPVVKPSKSKKRSTKEDEDIDEILAAQAAAQKSSAPAIKAHVVEFPDIVPGTFVPEKESTPKPEAASKEKKSKKRKTKKTAAALLVSQSDDASSSADDPNASVSNLNPEPPSTSKKKKKGKAIKASANQENPASLGASSSTRGTTVRQTAFGEAPDDGPWTRVESRKRTPGRTENQGEQMASDAGITTSVTETSSLATERTDDDEDGNVVTLSENRKTFAEKMLPKPRKTGVEDMLETPTYPTLARVIRVQPEPGEKPAEGFSWGDYEDVAESDMKDSWQESADGSGDDGWGVVKSRSRSKFTNGSPSSPAAVQRTTAPETLTKRQRQNKAKRDAEKSAKLEAEAERKMLLEKHKKELEKGRIDEQWKNRGKTNDSVASISEKGSLVWS